MLDYEIKENNKISFKVKKEIYPLEAIYRAAYLFTDNYYIGIDQNEEEYIIFFSGKEKDAGFEDLGRFQNELLNQCMKLAINKDTRQIRELIVTRALYSAFIPEEQKETEDYNEYYQEDKGEYHLEEIAEAWSNEE